MRWWQIRNRNQEVERDLQSDLDLEQEEQRERGLLSRILASVGLYGVLSYLTTQRTGEIGVRLALGAGRGEIVRLMLGDGLRPAWYGLTFGLAASVGAVRPIQSMFYGTGPLDPAVFASVAASLLLVACLAPAWKAARIDPLRALRNE